MAVDGTAQRHTTAGMRRVLIVASGLVFTLGAILYLGSSATDRFFAWTIQVPLTAAILGAAYLSSGPSEIIAARTPIWANARLAGLPVLIFSVITLGVTAVHRDLFHFGLGHPATALVVAWAWLVVYVAFPIAMTVGLIGQRRAAGADPPRRHRLSRVQKLALGVPAVVLTGTGVALLLAPTSVARLWPWSLTPLTARALGAWGVGLGFGLAQAIWENDWQRLRAAIPIYPIFGGLGLLTLLRYADSVQWRRPSAWLLMALLVGLLAGGLYAAALATRGQSIASGDGLPRTSDGAGG
jgi:hypothetical protein